MMKSKNAPQPRMQKIVTWLPLLLALSFTLILLGVTAYGNSLSLSTSSMLHVLRIIDPGLFMGIAAFTDLVVILFYFRELWIGASNHSITGLKLGAAVLLLFSLGRFRSDTLYIFNKQTLLSDQSSYQLLQEQVGGSTSYVVLECDLRGVSCHFYARPFTKANQCFNPNEIFLKEDPETQQLILIGETSGIHITFEKGYSDNINTGCR